MEQKTKQFTQKVVMFAASLDAEERVLFKQILEHGRKLSPGAALQALEAVDFHKLFDW
jgi:hypothetical protein